jgi:hypothetical protein
MRYPRIRFADSLPFDTGSEASGVGAESWVGGRKNATGYSIETGDAGEDDNPASLGSIGAQIAAAQRGSLGMNIVTSAPVFGGGKKLVRVLPPGIYGMLTRPGGEVELWQFEDANYVDLGNISDGLRGGINEAAGGARTTNPRVPSLGTRVGDAAAREARKVAEKLASINRINADFWKPGGGAGVK